MKIISIDVSKNSLDLLHGEDPEKSVSSHLENNPQALQEFLKQYPNLSPADWVVVLESTGDYHRTPAIFFLNHGFTVKLLNPILTKQFTRGTIRKTKTDKKDAKVIMKLALAGEGDIISLDELNNTSKELMRLSHFLTKLKTQLKLKLQSVEAKALAGEEAGEEINELINRMQEIVERLDGEAIKEANEQVNFIDSIPGFSAKLSQIVINECGDIRRFKSANVLVAFAGLAPKITQSGHSLNHTGKLTKRGSSFLRYALFLAARVAWRYDQELYDYYEKKRKEGRSFTEAIVIIARKLLHRIYAVVKDQRFYILSSRLT